MVPAAAGWLFYGEPHAAPRPATIVTERGLARRRRADCFYEPGSADDRLRRFDGRRPGGHRPSDHRHEQWVLGAARGHHVGTVPEGLRPARAGSDRSNAAPEGWQSVGV